MKLKIIVFLFGLALIVTLSAFAMYEAIPKVDTKTRLETLGFDIEPVPQNTFALAKATNFTSFIELAEHWNITTIYQDSDKFYIVKSVLTQEPDFNITIGYYTNDSFNKNW
jgi:hypothetical protein